MPTIHDVARKANVSVITVSRAMNNPQIVSAKTMKKIRIAMDDLGYQPSHVARSLVRRKTNPLGIVMPDIKNTFFNNWFRWVEDHARTFGYTLLLCNTDENPEHELNHVRLLHSQRVDGIMIAAHSPASITYLRKSKMPFILVDRLFKGVAADCITTDHYTGAFEAIRYLLGLGHSRIAVLRGPGILYPDVERFRGFSDAMKSRNKRIDPLLVRDCGFNETRAFGAVTDLLRLDTPPTAIFSFNSLMTIGAIKAIESMKLSIPRDVSLCGFDEIPGYSIVHPSVTSVLQPIEELGRIATKILLQSIEHPGLKRTRRIFLQPRLVTGESCLKLSSMKSNKGK